MVNRDVIIQKIANIKRGLDRLKEKEAIGAKQFLTDKDTQDIVLLNLQVAIQGRIDIASHIVSDNGWGIPGSLAGLFDSLCEKKVISGGTKKIMRSMVGFRNLIVHEYAELDMDKVYDIFSNRLTDFNQAGTPRLSRRGCEPYPARSAGQAKPEGSKSATPVKAWVSTAFLKDISRYTRL